ncbi:MAG: peptide-methionine (S)-S-oxide reductase MsrA, partial [Bacteroidales bacterium]|nr:peptide-methionine (S)-S-oxide reductase MsrA [Bacteroidales bacterium]
GTIKNPTYREVSSGYTNHAEVVQIVYNPTVIPLERLLEIFFKSHDPTTLNRQGADIGTQYRSVIFYHNTEQKDISLRLINELNKSGIWTEPIVTEVIPFEAFYKAEDYHQDYFENNPFQPYCQVVINPKMKKLEKFFSDYLK